MAIDNPLNPRGAFALRLTLATALAFASTGIGAAPGDTTTPEAVPQVLHGGAGDAGDTEFIVSADLLDGSARESDPHCALAISANHINGQFVAVVLKYTGPVGSDAGPAMSVRISPGTVDWRYGIESYLEPDEAWLEFDGLSTRTLGRVTSAPYAMVHERHLDAREARQVFEQALGAALTVRVDASGIENRYPLAQAFVDDVAERARACAARLAHAP